MGISGNYFKYDGISSKQMYGLFIANNKTSFTDNPIEGEKKYITAQLPHSKKFTILGQSVDTPYTFDIEFFTEQLITPAMHREITKWLFGRPTNCKFEIIDFDYEDVFYNCIIHQASDFKGGNQYGCGTHGYKATVVCDASAAWEDKKTNSYNQFLDSLHIVGTKTGSSVSFDTTYSAKLDLSLDGQSSQTVTAAGKNMFTPTGILTGINNVDIFALNTGTISIQGTTASSDFTVRFTPNLINGIASLSDSVFLPLTNGKKYTFSITSNISNDALNYDLAVNVNSGTSVLATSTALADSVNFTPITFMSDGRGVTSIDIKFKSGMYFSKAYNIEFQLEEGESATEWEQPHPCSPSPSYPASITNVLNPMINVIGSPNGNSYTTLVELCRLSDTVYDTLDIITGRKTQVINNHAFTGTETCTINDNTQINTIQFAIPISDMTRDTLLISNRFGTQTYANINVDDNSIIADTNQILVRINKSFLSTANVAGFKSWLVTNSTNVIYQQTYSSSVQSTACPITSCIGTTAITTNNTMNPTLHLNWYSDVPTFNFINSSDDTDLSYPIITITVGANGGTVGIKNKDDNNNVVQFTGTVAHEVIIMDEYGQVKSSTGNSKYNTWNHRIFILKSGNNHITAIGDVANLDVTYQNVRRCGI